jgi:hypothetical protein
MLVNEFNYILIILLLLFFHNTVVSSRMKINLVCLFFSCRKIYFIFIIILLIT